MKKHSHSIVAFLAVVLASFFGLELYAAVSVSVWYASREHTQAEYRYIEKYCNGNRGCMPWWGGFSPKAWNYDSFVNDALIPILISFSIVIIYWSVS